MQQAREHHQAAHAAQMDASQHRELRDLFVTRLREEDPQFWTYERLAAAVGCSSELIAVIIRRHKEGSTS